MKGKRLAGVVVIIYVIFLVLCSASWLSQLSFGGALATVTHSVAFEEGSFKKDAASIAVVLHDGETEKLSEFTALQTADFRGSACVEEIYAWASAHPEVEVYYDVTLPSGAKAENRAQAVNFSGIGHDTLEEYTACLKYLPMVESVDLGSSDMSAAPLTAEDLTALEAACPGKSFSYSFTVGNASYSLAETALDLSGIDAGDASLIAEYLPCMKSLTSVELGSENSTKLSWADIAMLVEAGPQAEFSYSFTLYGKSFTLADETIDLSGIQITDDGAAAVEALPALKNCKTLDMDDRGIVQGLSYERMQAIRDQFPQVDVVWRIWFGQLYSVRTDTDRILASKPSVGGILDDAEVDKLKYCTKVKYIDLGHNESIYSLGFAESMPELEVLIVAMNPLSDISPLKSCTKLEYLEIFTTNVSDLSPLSGLTSLRHLNISNCPNITDISPLYGLTELERLWIGTKTPVPEEQVQEMAQKAPNCKISTVSSEEQGDAWRYTRYDENLCKFYWVPRYEKLAEQLGYFTPYKSYSFYWLDPECQRAAPEEWKSEYYLD